MESKKVWLFVHKDLTFKINGQKDRTATSRVKDMYVRNNEPSDRKWKLKGKFDKCTIIPVASNNTIEAGKAPSKQIVE